MYAKVGLDVNNRSQLQRNFLLCGGHMKEHIYAVAPKTIENLLTRIRVDVTTAFSRECRAVHSSFFGNDGTCFEPLL